MVGWVGRWVLQSVILSFEALHDLLMFFVNVSTAIDTNVQVRIVMIIIQNYEDDNLYDEDDGDDGDDYDGHDDDNDEDDGGNGGDVLGKF